MNQPNQPTSGFLPIYSSPCPCDTQVSLQYSASLLQSLFRSVMARMKAFTVTLSSRYVTVIHIVLTFVCLSKLLLFKGRALVLMFIRIHLHHPYGPLYTQSTAYPKTLFRSVHCASPVPVVCDYQHGFLHFCPCDRSKRNHYS